MIGTPLIRSLLQEVQSPRFRSTTLTPLKWLLATIFLTMLGCVRAQLPSWVLQLLGILVAVLVFAFLAAYFYLLIKDRDGLRSKNFALLKTAIERGFPPDKLTDLVEQPPKDEKA